MEEEKVRRKIIGETWLNEVKQLTKWYEDLRKEYKKKFGHHRFFQVFPLQELPRKFDAFLVDLASDCGIEKEFETLKYVILNPGKSIFGITSALGGPTHSTVKRDIDTLVSRFFLVRIDTNFARKARFVYPDPFFVKARARAYAGLEQLPIPMVKRIDVSFLWMQREGKVLLEKREDISHPTDYGGRWTLPCNEFHGEDSETAAYEMLDEKFALKGEHPRMVEMLIFPSKIVAEKAKITLLFHIWIVRMNRFHGKIPFQSSDTKWTLKWFSEDEMSKMAESDVWPMIKDLWFLWKIARLG